MTEDKFVRRSLRTLSAELESLGHDTCPTTVAEWLRDLGYNLRVNVKRLTGPTHPDRDRQFRYLEGIIAELMGEEWEDPFEAFLTYYEERHPDYVRPFPGVHALLQWLSGQGARLGVVTGKGARTAEVTLRLLDLAGYFDVVVAGSPDGSRKPEALRQVVERWTLAPATVAYVGDSANDMAAARSVGAVGLGAAWAGEATAEALSDAGATAVFATPEDLHEWLQKTL